ncbi:hypothetical protein LT336_00570 [Spiroplasma sp. JKS002671]|uniref:hypothetical protein n=1 Tax=Spiroplasma attinicola TaxID=2904537 RepID=UPI002022A2E9|nr:hypothetical protein [Spiroplasma sp. JKS002671]MCL8210826.1 hypothetical protein [Spiroplasma sp. JKS002671]
MAKDLTKEILPIEEEQKQEKKLLYKNWKIYATALGVITVGLAVGLGVGLGVSNSSHNTTSPEQQIVNAINNTTTAYTLTANTTNPATAASITEQITGDFIKTKLTGNNATVFKAESFQLNSITVGEDNHALADSDLTTAGTINAKINYNYDSIKNQTTILTITIAVTEQQQVVNAINDITYTVSAVTVNEAAKSITDQINADFIKAKLTGNNATAFKSESFQLNSITFGKDNHALADSDLTTAGTINAKINYSYDTIANQSTTLTFKVNLTDAEITNAINSTEYTLTTVTAGDEATTVSAKINASFIKSSLSEDIQNSFNSESFQLKSITVGEDNHALADSDLTTAGPLTTKVNYDYGSVKDQNITLTITINASDQQIVDAINLSSYTVEAYVGDTTENITNQINGELIKAKLTDTDNIATSFDSNSFSFSSITVGKDNHALADSDLTTAGTLTTKINYQYGGKEKITGTTNLTITTKNVDENAIENAIENATYQISYLLTKDKAADISKSITNNFIFDTLKETSLGIAKGFEMGVFKFTSITIDNHELLDSDLSKVRTYDAKINFEFNSKEYSSNLTMSCNLLASLPIQIGSLVNDDNKNFTLEGVTTASTDTEIKNAILDQILVITKDILGEQWDSFGSLVEPVLKTAAIITLDNNSIHQGATITAAEGTTSNFVQGSAVITFTLPVA